jgi:hypothetical protein
MELIARNFLWYPETSLACQTLSPLLSQLGEVRFPYAIGERNSNQFTFNFDPYLKAALLARGSVETKLVLPKEVKKENDFVFFFAGKKIVVEVEKSNREKILYDFMKFHIYFGADADFALLFLPENWAHSSGETDLFAEGKHHYQHCLKFGFGTPESLGRILLVGYKQYTVEGKPVTAEIRRSLVAAQKRAATS